MFCIAVVIAASRAVFGFNKKPAIDWQSRVFSKSFPRLTNFTRVAQRQNGALPKGQMSLNALGRLHLSGRASHLFARRRNTMRGGLSKRFEFRGSFKTW